MLQVRVSVFDAMNLKNKRRVIKSLKDRISNKFNVSIAEVEHQDSIRTSVLGVSMVANDSRFVQSALMEIVNFIQKTPQCVLIDYDIETI